ncbi:MAG TPA: class I SAM-dependent methyltransferase [Candidatus Omnitrophica bacterium]|nr:class I SAM-dependent methyltransferase [Candidatus Omnitrophota bacterium]
MAINKGDYIKGGTQKETYTKEDVVFVSCPLCAGKKYSEIYKERGVLGIVRCLDCGLIYVNPRLKDPEKVYWGNEEIYFEEARLIFEGKAQHHRDPNYRDDLKIIHKFKPSGNFLDIGTNIGFFLRNARGRNWDLYGVEPSPSLSEIARKYFKLNIKTGFLHQAGFKDDFFDIVTMTDVFEHLSQPEDVLVETHRVMKSDGILFIKVPNGNFNLFKYYWAKKLGKLIDYDVFDSYEHVVHYTQKTLSLMLGKFNFKLVKIFIGRPIQCPVWHDYVGHYYQYPTPWILDYKRCTARSILYLLSLLEYKMRFNNTGYLAPNIIAIAKKA